MKLKYKGWQDITVNVFKKLKSVELGNGDMIDNLNANIQLLSILCDCDEDEIASLSRNEFSKLLSQTEFLKSMPKSKIQDKYVVNGKRYDVFLSLKEMSVAQYIDFQSHSKDKEKYFNELLTVFLIPHGKNYGEGYNVADVAEELGNHLSIVDAYSILFFFILLYQTLTRVTLDCSLKDMRKMMKKAKTKEEKEKLEMAIAEMTKARDLARNGAGFISLT